MERAGASAMPSGHELEWLSLEDQPVNLPAWRRRGFGSPVSLTVELWTVGGFWKGQCVFFIGVVPDNLAIPQWVA